MVFQCTDICQVPGRGGGGVGEGVGGGGGVGAGWCGGVLKTAASGLGFQPIPRDLANVNAWKNMFDRYITIVSYPIFSPIKSFVSHGIFH